MLFEGPESVTIASQAPPTWPPAWAAGWGIERRNDRLLAHAGAQVGNAEFTFRWISPGSFLMGSPSDEPGRWEDEWRHLVTLNQGFWLASTPCTQAQWQAVMGGNPSHHEGEDRPVESVSWDNTQAFIDKLSLSLPDLKPRLPTEAEWEYACRADTNSAFNDGSPCTVPGGRDEALVSLGWFDENSEDETHPVGELCPNAWGLYDMHGNVWEWCEDRANVEESLIVTDTYVNEIIDPLCRVGARRVVRGGSFLSDAGFCRSACRGAFEPGLRFRYLGFRLAAGQQTGSGAGGPAAEGAVAPGSREATSADGPTAERNHD
jgi:formylglycine-generating enzyme required for sulfatase activity